MNEEEYRIARMNMVKKQIAARGVRDRALLAVFESVPRHRFVPVDDLPWAYADGPLPIGHGQTISQPYIVALMTELLQVQSSHHVLEVGTGSGYQAAILGRLAREVETIEMVPELAARAEAILAELAYTTIHVHCGDGTLGWLQASPYDGILVAAAAPSAPKPLLEQLKDGGRLVIPVGDRGYQQLEVWQRAGEEFERQVNLAVAFVPLRGKYGWKSG